MSFSKSIKQELVKQKRRNKEVSRAELIGLTHACAALIIGRPLRLLYASESYDVGKHIASVSSWLYKALPTIALRDTGRLRQTIVTLEGEGINELLYDSGLLVKSDDGLKLNYIVPSPKDDKSKLAFLRGAFLGAGSVSDPKRSYHLEIICKKEPFAEAVSVILDELECKAKTVKRNDNTVVYLKDGDRIFRFLALMGACDASLKFEDARVQKELRNYINRTSNCETANIGKTVNASADQIEAIKKVLADPRLIKSLSPKLRETAQLRLENPQLSLSELGELSGLGKSCLNHRLRRIVELSEKTT